MFTVSASRSWNTLELIEQSRQALGGHGYSSYAGLASLYADFAVQCSWEGDNTIMMLQLGRYLISCYRDAKKGVKQPPGNRFRRRSKEYDQLAERAAGCQLWAI